MAVYARVYVFVLPGERAVERHAVSHLNEFKLVLILLLCRSLAIADPKGQETVEAGGRGTAHGVAPPGTLYPCDLEHQ